MTVKPLKPRCTEVKTETLFFNPSTPPAKAEPKADEPSLNRAPSAPADSPPHPHRVDRIRPRVLVC